MGYMMNPQIFNFDLKTADMAGAPSDNTDLRVIMIPAGREIEIQDASAYVTLASDGADFLEVVDESDTVLCKFALQTTGKKEAVASDGSTASTFPIRLAPQSTTARSLLKIRTGGGLDTTTEAAVQLKITGL